jgi:inhibitor of the pro-sigma K processing machinery
MDEYSLDMIGGMFVDLFTMGIIITSILILFAFLSQVKWLPLHWIGKGIFHLVIGALLLFFLNLIGGVFDFQVPLNLVTVAIAGFLGIPGTIALACIKLFII